MKTEDDYIADFLFEIAALEEQADREEGRSNFTIASNMRLKARGLVAELREARKAVN